MVLLLKRTFGKTIQDSRKNKRYSGRKLAELVGIDFTYLSKIENNKTGSPPSEHVVRLLARKLGLDELQLIYLSGRMLQEDSQLLEDVIKQYPFEMAELFKKIRKTPSVLPKIFAVRAENE